MKQSDFDQYIRQVEPKARESAEAWNTAIGLQAVDGLKPSPYLLDLAKRNIDGEISIDEVCRMLDIYYHGKTAHRETDDKPTITDDKPTIILAHLKKKGACRTAELAALLGLKSTQTKTYLYQLLKEGKIVAHGANRNRTYSLA